VDDGARWASRTGSRREQPSTQRPGRGSQQFRCDDGWNDPRGQAAELPLVDEELVEDAEDSFAGFAAFESPEAFAGSLAAEPSLETDFELDRESVR
jgi:hypothetical protein